IKDMPIEHIRRLRQAYFASITFLDAQVGLMLDALEDNGLMDKTIIVFWSDHGYFIGEKALWYKFKNYETAFRSPLIIAAPGMAPGDCERVVELLDIYPTVTDLAGLTPQSKLEGASLRPLMENPKAAWARPAIGQNNVGYSIRTEQYRFTRYGESLDQWELYDHTNDPEERANLIRQNKSLEIAKQLNETLKPYRGSKSGKKKK
ncbi:MAG: sulfatase/phosphatase domain-containing protein, partial [Verrucomicrobiota bacterium]